MSAAVRRPLRSILAVLCLALSGGGPAAAHENHGIPAPADAHRNASPATSPIPGADMLPAAAMPASVRVFASTHYRIHTDLPRKHCVPFGRHMDAVYAEYVRRFGGETDAARDPMDLYLFATRERYLDFLRSIHINGRHSAGMFFASPRISGLATYVQGQSRADTFAVLRHEGFHQFAWRFYGRTLPQWANEGIAEVFGDAPLANGELHLGPMDTARLARVQRDLAAGRTLSLEELIALDSRDWNRAIDGDPERLHTLYAQSWSIVYFMLRGNDGRHRAALVRYLNLLRRGVDDASALKEAFGVRTLDPIEQRWKIFVRSAKPTHLDEAEDRLRFLAEGLRHFAKQRLPYPRDIDQMQSVLQRIGFAVDYNDGQKSTILRASDLRQFSFITDATATRSPQLASFELLSAARDDLPPRITAPGLNPEPTLIWTRLADGSLADDIVYR